MHTNGNGQRPSFQEWEGRLWEAADPEMHETTLWAAHVKDSQTRGVLFRVLTFLKQLREWWRLADEAIGNLYGHGLRQQQEIRALEDVVLGLSGKVEALARRERERSAREALAALDAGEDIEKVLTDLGRPVAAATGTAGGEDNGEVT